MATKAQIRAEAARIFAAFRQAGADTVEADILQPAETLLDLYGEDIRARAFVTTDPLRGEMMLRPDFTVPIVQMHMRGSGAMARYAYMGEVFRKQEHEVGRPAEYFQAGYELFDAPDAANADAEVFALFAGILAPSGLKAVTGDIGILLAAVEGLATTERRKRALARHIWRPRRFRTLLDRFSGRTPAPPHRKALRDAAAAKGVQVMLDQAGPEIGRRSREEVAATVPGPGALRIDQPHVGFVDQRGRLQGLAGTFLGHAGSGELAQLVVDQRQELLGGRGIAGFDLGEDGGDVGHCANPSPKDFCSSRTHDPTFPVPSFRCQSR